MKRIALLLPLCGAALVWACGGGRTAGNLPVYQDPDAPIEKRVEDALSRMTLEEKVAVCHGQSNFSSAGVPRLGIPELWTSDGPHGVRAEVGWVSMGNMDWNSDSCTAYPALTCLAATWNPELSLLYGKSIGEEARYRKKDVLLGPGVNIYRTPLNGRNFEYMGEDPYLASEMVVPYIQGVQSNGVAACVKHFALNNQEVERKSVDVYVDDRALHEIYLPAFKAAVQRAGVWSLMGSYNKYRGTHCCHNDRLLNDILKGEWGFDGAVISDWNGTHDTREAALNGLDLEMGTSTPEMKEMGNRRFNAYYLADPFLKMLRAGEVDEKVLDEKVRRVLRLMFRTTMSPDRPWGAFATEEHAAAARKIAEEGIVLLRNEGNILPLDPARRMKIAVVGENAVKMLTVGGGSSKLKVKREVSPLEGVKRVFGERSEIVYAPGYEYTRKADSSAMKKEAVEAAKGADVVLFFGGLNKEPKNDCEGHDRLSLHLPYGQDGLIAELAAVNRNVVVVLLSGNAVAMPWLGQVPAVVQGWYLGSEAGNALAAVLSGEANPSGRLPFTFPAKLTDCAAHAVGDYPGEDGKETYNEGVFVGYRWTDREKIEPLFPFGHGLSYTGFEYGEVSADRASVGPGESLTVAVPVKNVGLRAGAEVVQLYVSDLESSLPRPVKELKGFRKVTLQPGEETVVKLTVAPESLCYYDDRKGEWVAEPGRFKALVGASSADIRGEVSFELK